MIEVIAVVTLALLGGLALSCLVVLPAGLLRWRMARLYWQTHEGGSAGYRRDCLLLALPLSFLMLGLALGAALAGQYGFAVYLFIAPIALGLGVALAVLPPFRRASIRIMRAHYPLEGRNVR